MAQYRGFLNIHNIDKYLQLGNENSIVLSLNVPKDPFFICAVIAHDPSITSCTTDYINILQCTPKHFNPIKRREKTHSQSGLMYPYGYRGIRKASGFESYTRLPQSISNPKEWNIFSNGMDRIGSHYSEILKTYFSTLEKQFKVIQQQNYSPHIGTSYAGNFMTAFNFASAAHFDKLDSTYAFGVWYDVGHGRKANSAFVFPEFRIAIQLHNGLCALWNSEKALHCTTQSSPHEIVRIGTVVQLNKTLLTKANKAWINNMLQSSQSMQQSEKCK